MTIAGIAADIVLLVHFAFIIFVVVGGIMALRWPQLVWAHLPCLAWGVIIEFTGRVCPLTPLELHFRMMAGEAGYSGDFINRYLAPVIYPAGLSRQLQIGLGIALLLGNSVLYTLLWHRRQSTRTGQMDD